MSALRQQRLIIVGATIGAIGGSVALRTSNDLRPVAIAVAAGAVLLGLTCAMEWLANQPVPRLAPAYSSLIGRVAVTLAATLSVILVFNLLVATDARSVPARPNAQATVRPVPAVPTQIADPTTPVSTGLPVVPASPQQVVRPPAPTSTASSPPLATVQPAFSPAATSPVSPFATPQAPQPSPPPSAAAVTSPPTTIAPATPQPTGVPSLPSIIPTLPPLPTIRLP